MSRFSERPANAYSRFKDDPTIDGTVLTYGPYENIPPQTYEPIRVKYEYNQPLIEITKLERELWVSHSGGNLATEERYWLTNSGAELTDHFSRVRWQATTMAQQSTPALKAAQVHLRAGVRDVYFTDEIGNVSTSNLRDDYRDPVLEFRPRYPVFGGWNYSFTLGWNHDLARSVRETASEGIYVLRVPLLEGPVNAMYDEADVLVVLPEGAKVLAVDSSYKDMTEELTSLYSHLDVVGRTVVKLSARDMTDEHRRNELYVTYELSKDAQYRKPIRVATAVFAVFFAIILLGKVDVSISKKA